MVTFRIVRNWGPEGVVTNAERGERHWKDPTKWEAVFVNDEFRCFRRICDDPSWPVICFLQLQLDRLQKLVNKPFDVFRLC
jgi:hypothetical protein